MLVALIAVGAWFFLRLRRETAGLVKGNGRIEATEIDVATKIAGRVREGAVSSSEAAQATIARIKADLDECALRLREPAGCNTALPSSARYLASAARC